MSNNTWKQQGKDFWAERKRERREREERREAELRQRAADNALLKAHGYTWHKIQDIGGPSDDGDNADTVWQLYDADGHAVSKRAALEAIAAKHQTPS